MSVNYMFYMGGFAIILWGLSMPFRKQLQTPLLYFAVGMIFMSFLKNFLDKTQQLNERRKNK